MKKWLFILLGALAAAVLIAYLMGRRLPHDHMAIVRAHYHQPPDSIYNAIADVAAYPKWRTDVKRVTVLPPNNGRQLWREIYGRDSLEFEGTVAVPPVRMVATIATKNAGFSGRWSYQIIPDSSGTTVTITEDGSVDSPLFRFMMRYVFGPYSTLEKFERALGARFGETVQPVRVY
jgi:uncharacterized protein YndB with AHSA1/START domain